MPKISRTIAALVVAFAGINTVAGNAQTIVAPTQHGLFAPAPYASAPTVIRQAERGNVKAAAQLGWMFSTGRGVPQDYAKAAQWYYRAAVRGYGWAQFELGMLYNTGQGVPCDYLLSYMWLNLSASQAVGDDRDYKVRMRDAIASKLTPGEVAEAQHMALAWYKMH